MSRLRNRCTARAAPRRAKGDPVTLGTLAVTLAPIVLTGLTKALKTWLARHERASVSLESGGEKLVLTGSPSKEQRQLVDAFIRGHAMR